MSSLRVALASLLALVALAPSCSGPAPELCGEGEGEDQFFGPTLAGDSAPAEEGTMPLNGILHVAARNQGVPVDATLKTGGIDSTERDADVDEVGPVVRVLFDDLVAETSYVATMRIDPGEAPNGVQTVRELRFATTTIVDDALPLFDGEPSIEVVRSVNGDECSGDGTLVDIISPEVVDDSGVAGVKLFAVASDGVASLLTFAIGSGRVVVQRRETGIEADYRLVAVDLAGNESAPLEIDVP